MDRYYIELHGETVAVELSEQAGHLRAVVDGREYLLESIPVNRDSLSLRFQNDSYFVHVAPEDEHVRVKIRGSQYRPRVFSDREWHFHTLTGGGAGGQAEASLKAPMPGKVLDVKVAIGDLVEEGTPLVILEAMKMENELKASCQARVAAVHVAPGEAVEGDHELISFEPVEEEA
jgi:biotin carboxyl carrier protein